MNQQLLKTSVQKYWNKVSCGTEFIKDKKFTHEYFEAIEQFRYLVEPEVFAFAQFTRFYGKKILEVGVGAGTDFVQWVRAGAMAHGIDLTQEAVNNTRRRLRIYGFKAESITIGDAENLRFDEGQFDLVYSWGVIHHSPDTQKCINEIVRVTKPGGSIKLMIYNRRSLFAWYRWLKVAFLRGKVFKSVTDVLFDNQESPGTKAYTISEVKKMLSGLPVDVKNIKATVTAHDLLYYKPAIIKFFAYTMACILGWNKVGWFMTIELFKKEKRS